MYGDRVLLGVACLILIIMGILGAGVRLFRATEPAARRQVALQAWNTFAVLALVMTAMRLLSGTVIRIILNNDVGPVERHILTVTTLFRVHSHICLCQFLCLAFAFGLAFILRSSGQRSLHCNLALNGTLLALGLQALALPRASFGADTSHYDPNFVEASCIGLELYMSTLKVAVIVLFVVATLTIGWSRYKSSVKRGDLEEPKTRVRILAWAVGGLFLLHLLVSRPSAALETYEIAVDVCKALDTDGPLESRGLR